MFFWQDIMEPSMTHSATRCIILLLNLQNKLDIKERGQRRWSHRFMFAHKSVPHLSSQHALARMVKTLSFHKPQDVLLAEHHGTFHDTPSNTMHHFVA
jgi:hypothetical protein